jgi:hypothetical protein
METALREWTLVGYFTMQFGWVSNSTLSHVEPMLIRNPCWPKKPYVIGTGTWDLTPPCDNRDADLLLYNEQQAHRQGPTRGLKGRVSVIDQICYR